jgi:pentatricopeptide repeat protein
MQEDSVNPNRITFQALVKACGRVKCIKSGWQVHAEIAMDGLESDPFIASTLVDMYAKCGSLAEAQLAFDESSVQDTVAWTALLSAYADHGLGKEALICLEKMKLDGVVLDDVTFICGLKACANIQDIEKGCAIHMEVTKKGLESKPLINNALVGFYAKCGRILEARCQINRYPISDVVSWTSLMTLYVECGHALEAIECFAKLQSMGLTPDSVTYLCILKACGSIGAIDKARDIHVEVVKEGFEGDTFIGNCLVDIYATRGLFMEAHEVLDELPSRDVVSWNSLMAGYVDHDLAEGVMECLEQMILESITPNATSFVCILKACASLREISKGQEAHKVILEDGIEGDSFIGNTLVEFYAKCGCFMEAKDVFSELSERSIISWNALASGYAEHGLGGEVINIFTEMQGEGESPDAIMFIRLLKGCVQLHSAEKGQLIHAEIACEGYEKDPFVGSSLIDMYAKCGMLAEAQEILEEHDQSIVSWNALMTGYSEQGHAEEVLRLCEKMCAKGLPLDVTSFICCLKACASIGAKCVGNEIHTEICKRGYDGDLSIGSMLVDMHAKCSSLEEAEHVFSKLQVRNAVSWTALISAYADRGFAEEALVCFEDMVLEGVCPDVVTYICSLKACGSLGAIHKGQELHRDISMEDIGKDVRVGNVLVDMYAKCGALKEAQEIFEEVSGRTLVSWSALMAGYACQGKSKSVFSLLDRMIEEDMRPDKVIFLSVLSVCSHGGLVEEGQIYFEIMNRNYGIFPTNEHQNCMVDLLGRAGQLREAVSMLEAMPVRPDHVTWNTILGACQKWGEPNLASYVFNHALGSDERASLFITMSNICMDAHVSDEEDTDRVFHWARRVEKMEGGV